MYKGDLSARNATLNFISPVHPTQPLLRVTGDADVSGSACNVGLAGGTSLASGSTLTLLEVDPDKTLTANNLQRGNGIVQIGSTVAHDITADVNLDPTTRRLNAVTAQVSPGRATDQSRALSEGFLGGLALNLQGADLVAGRGMDSAVPATFSGTDDAERHGFAGFGALSGGSLRYNTGSHLDMNSLSLLTGLAWGIDLAPGRLTLGAFFEYGNGSYDTHNSFTNAASVDGDGNASISGGGILARMDGVFRPGPPTPKPADARARRTTSTTARICATQPDVRRTTTAVLPTMACISARATSGTSTMPPPLTCTASTSGHGSRATAWACPPANI